MLWVQVDNMHEQIDNINRVKEIQRKKQKEMLEVKNTNKIKNIFDPSVERT